MAMAISPKSISFLLVLALFSIQIHARESRFFSKVSTTIVPTTTTPTTTTTTTINDRNEKEISPTAVPTKEQEGLTKQEQEQEPTFIPETQNGNYGLYSQEQETNQFPTTTKLGNSPYTTPTTYTPYKTTQTQETYTNSYPSSNNYYYQNNNNHNYEEQQQQEEDSLVHTSNFRFDWPPNSPTRTSTYSTNNNNMEKQGMSDTRYLENGKYYYDLSNENNNYYLTNQYQNSRSSYTTEGYNNQFYDTNSNNEQFREYSNTMGNYQNQEEVFPVSGEEQYIP